MFRSILPRTLQIAFYVGTLVTLVLALISPYEYQAFITQNFQFWIAAEFLVIHGTGFALAVQKGQQRVRLLLVPFYGVLFFAFALLFNQALLAGVMFVNLLIQLWTLQSTEQARRELGWRTCAYFLAAFGLFFTLHLIYAISPEYMSTSDPLYMQIMPQVEAIGWVLGYYTLSALMGIALVIGEVPKRRT